jgi:predicted aldo/keto reductase-like oxidoreductase
VLIPGCFEAYNKMHMFGDVETVKFSYALRMSGILVDGKPRYASQCVECGECLDKCPQHIRIPEFLAKVAAEMEGPEMEQRLAVARKMFLEEQK